MIDIDIQISISERSSGWATTYEQMLLWDKFCECLKILQLAIMEIGTHLPFFHIMSC